MFLVFLFVSVNENELSERKILQPKVVDNSLSLWTIEHLFSESLLERRYTGRGNILFSGCDRICWCRTTFPPTMLSFQISSILFSFSRFKRDFWVILEFNFLIFWWSHWFVSIFLYVYSCWTTGWAGTGFRLINADHVYNIRLVNRGRACFWAKSVSKYC